MRALLVLLALVAAQSCSAQRCTFSSFAPLLADQPGLTIINQIVKTLEATNSAAVPVPADSVTFLAPTDDAFIALLQNSGLSTAVAQRTLAAKGVSILLYHLLDGSFTPAQLLSLTTIQTNLGRAVGRSLPLTFGRGPTAGAVLASGVANEGTLSAAIPVCTSNVYVIDAVLLPARTLATVPAATVADAPAEEPALAPALGPTVDVAAEAPSVDVVAGQPALGPSEDVLAPLAAPDAAPAPSVALEPSFALGPAPGTALAPAPSGVAATPAVTPTLPIFGDLAPSSSPDQGAVSHLTSLTSSLAVLLSALAAVATFLAASL